MLPMMLSGKNHFPEDGRLIVASSRRSVSQGAARKTAREKIKKSAGYNEINVRPYGNSYLLAGIAFRAL